MLVPFHADEKLGESVTGAMKLGIRDSNAPALSGCAQAHPSAAQIVAWPPAPKRLLCLLKPGAWSREYPNGTWRRELLPIALYDCVHGASGMPSEGQHALGTKYLRRKRRNAYNEFISRWCLWGRQLAGRRVICQTTPFRTTISPSAFLSSVPHFSRSRPTLFIPCGRSGVCAVSLARQSDDIQSFHKCSGTRAASTVTGTCDKSK